MSFSDKSTRIFIDELAAKKATPGGGAIAAMSAAQACALAEMAANYTTGKKWQDRADTVQNLIAQLKAARHNCLIAADADAQAYADLQRSWTDKDMSAEEKASIEARALSIPYELVLLCNKISSAIQAFLPQCNPNILSDAKAALHLMAGAAHAAYHTAMINKPSPAQTNDLQDALAQIRIAEQDALRL